MLQKCQSSSVFSSLFRSQHACLSDLTVTPWFPLTGPEANANFKHFETIFSQTLNPNLQSSALTVPRNKQEEQHQNSLPTASQLIKKAVKGFISDLSALVVELFGNEKNATVVLRFLAWLFFPVSLSLLTLEDSFNPLFKAILYSLSRVRKLVILDATGSIS